MFDQQVIEFKKKLFLEAYKKHDGKLAAVIHALGTSRRQTYKLYNLCSTEELSRCLTTPRARAHNKRYFSYRVRA